MAYRTRVPGCFALFLSKMTSTAGMQTELEPAMDKVAVSLVVCTRNRERQLSDCLAHIARMNTSVRWELVLVDNGSSDGTKGVLSRFASNVRFPVKIVDEPQQGKSRGLNRGIAASAGHIISFIDDDCYVAPDHIDRVLDVFADPRVGFAGGQVTLWDPTDYPMTIRTSSELQLYPPYSYIEGGLILGANMMFRRDALVSIRGFDTDFGPGTRLIAEDTDVQIRTSFRGWWGLYTPHVAVAHHHGRKAKDVGRLARQYSHGLGALNLKLLISPNTRGHAIKACYWYFLGVARHRYPFRSLLWELEGAALYSATQLRHYFFPSIQDKT